MGMGIRGIFGGRVRQVLGPVLGVCAIAYFAYHTFHGERGLIAWNILKQRVEEAQVMLAETRARRQVLEHRVRLLNPQSLDPDMLDERARLMLNYGRDDEIVIFLETPKGS